MSFSFTHIVLSSSIQFNWSMFSVNNHLNRHARNEFTPTTNLTVGTTTTTVQTKSTKTTDKRCYLWCQLSKKFPNRMCWSYELIYHMMNMIMIVKSNINNSTILRSSCFIIEKSCTIIISVVILVWFDYDFSLLIITKPLDLEFRKVEQSCTQIIQRLNLWANKQLIPLWKHHNLWFHHV